MWWSLVGVALAQEAPALNAQHFRPSVDAQSTLWADDTAFAPGQALFARAVVGYMNDPVRFVYDDGEEVAVLSDAVSGNLVLGAAFGRARVGIDVPFHLLATGTAGNVRGVGDVAVDLKVNALDRSVWPVGLAFSARFVAPTARIDAPLGDAFSQTEVAAIVDRRVGPWTATANVGGRLFATEGVTATELRFRPVVRAGVGYRLGPAGGLSADFATLGSYVYDAERATGANAEALLGGWVRLGDALVIRGGAGKGLTNAVGSPRARAVLAVGFEPPRERDADEDGIPDRLDECADEAEDLDRFADADGCPDPDNDRDGLADRSDDCPAEGEDLDGYEDGDGCPEIPTEIHLRVNGDDGRPLAGARVELRGAGIDPITGEGEFRVVVDPGAYSVRMTAPERVAQEFTAEVLPFARYEAIRTLDLENPTGIVTLDILAGSERDPRGGVWAEPGAAFQPYGERLTLAQGPWRLSVRAPGHGTALVDVRATAGAPSGVEVVLPAMRVTAADGRLSLTEAIRFGGDGGELPAEPQAVLDDLAGWLLDGSARVVIEGKAGGEGTPEQREILAERRALAVKRYLTARGVAPDRVEIAGVVVDGAVAEADWIAVRVAAPR